MATAAAIPPQEPVPLSQAQRLVNTFFAPSKTFTDLRRSAAWWAPFLITVIFSVVFVYVVDQKVGFRKVVENQLRLQPKQADRIERLPADQHEKAMQQQTSITMGISYRFPLLMLAWHAIVAGVLLATFKFGASAEIKYKTLFALVIYAGLPGLLKAVLAVVSLWRESRATPSLSRIRRHQSRLLSGCCQLSGAFQLVVFVGRPHHLDPRADGHRRDLRQQGQARDRPRRGLRLVCGNGSGRSWHNSGFFLICDKSPSSPRFQHRILLRFLSRRDSCAITYFYP